MSEVRKRILEYIMKRPGSHLREIVRGLGIAMGQAQYHLEKLQQEGEVVVYRIGRYKRYFPPQFTYEDAKIVGLMYLEGTRKVMRAIAEGPKGLREIAEEVGMSPQTVSFHIKLLEKYNVVERDPSRRYKLRNPRIREVIDLIEAGPKDKLLDRFLSFWTSGHRWIIEILFATYASCHAVNSE